MTLTTQIALADIADVEGLERAFDHVRRAGGAPGVDGTHVAAVAGSLAQTLADLAEDVASGRYVPSPLRSLRIPKAGSPHGRELLIPTVRDRILQRAAVDLLTPLAEHRLLDAAHGYRPGRSIHTALTHLRRNLDDRPWVLNADIEDFFGSVAHDAVARAAEGFGVGPDVGSLIACWAAAPALRAGALETRRTGIPLGAPISPLLANIVLHDVDVAMTRPEWSLVRFADDIKACAAERAGAESARATLTAALMPLGLRCNPGKTCVVDTRAASIAFVGHVVRASVSQHSDLEVPVHRTLYVTQNGAKLRRRGERLVVERDGRDIVVAPIRQVREVVIAAPCDVTSPALVAMLRQGIDVRFVDPRGRQLGRLETWKSRNPALRRRQVEVSLQEDASLRLARSFVLGKLRNQRRLLQRHSARTPDPRVTEALQQQTRAVALAERAPDVDTLRGAEGTGSRAHFSALSALIDPAWGFRGRVRRPPTDTINAMLSFGYVVLCGETSAAVAGAGLDPAIGFLHQPRPGRDSLALDLVEELRPVIVDALVLAVVHRRVLTPDDGERDPVTGGVLLGDEHRRTFLAEYERRMLTLFLHGPSGDRVSYRRALTLQAQQLARALFEPDASYRPIELR